MDDDELHISRIHTAWSMVREAHGDHTAVQFAQQRLLENSPSVLRLFRSNPFASGPPALVRTVRWQYWFTDLATKRRTGAWWRRKELGPFTGVVGAR